ncbi:uncharacterized protein LOC121375811 [Gigantopelta aegis]|uniref:uncharacterized protein LOC121375811 n=1 Tax=Gigantopelta aegis TaxID=1735272 RepID=UPI001B88CA2B|nr:uncharacterized protein LOC121375811 [Gigantopelta aegis]
MNLLGLLLVITQLVLINISPVGCKPNTVDSKVSKEIVIFGGNGFIGSATVEELLKRGHTLTLINRGNWYWDSEQTIKPRVQHVTCDRGIALTKCEEMVKYVENLNSTVGAIVDFSAFQHFAVVEATKLFRGKADLYIYISSDSVYEVCLKNHSNPSRETDAVRPNSIDERNTLAEKDHYGDSKLRCEEELSAQRPNGGIPFISLRLPDVIGPRDNTYRWWIYQMWLRLIKYLEKPVSVPRDLLNRPLSLVYSADVAKAVVVCLDPTPEMLDQAFNIAFEETPSLLEIMNTMKMMLNLTDISIKTDSGDEPLYLFPSVRLGPVDISKARDLLGWTPTPWLQAVNETIDFYEKAITNPVFETAKKDIIRTMQTYFTSRPLKVLVGLKKVYGVTYEGPTLSKDEL